MKNIIIILAAVTLLFSSCDNREEQFDEDFIKSYNTMRDLVIYSGSAVDKISDVWKTAIWDHKKPDGSNCEDFKDALEMIYDSLELDGTYDSIRVYKDKMLLTVGKLNNPPESRKQCYDDYLEIIGLVNKLARMGLSPSGSLFNYQSDTNSFIEEFSEKIDNFKLKYPQYFVSEDEDE